MLNLQFHKYSLLRRQELIWSGFQYQLWRLLKLSKKLKKNVNVPLITDIHFDYKIALKVAKYGADCLRINPGNIGKEDRIREVVAAAKDNGIPIRVGVNAGSLEKDLQKKIY